MLYVWPCGMSIEVRCYRMNFVSSNSIISVGITEVSQLLVEGESMYI